MITKGADMNDFEATVEPKDGRKIAFTSRGVVKEVFVATGAKQFTIFEFNPTYAPDGKWISFASNISGNYDVWLMKTDENRRLSPHPADDRQKRGRHAILGC
jgi:hypothetical protein